MTLDLGPGKNIQPHVDQPVIRLDFRTSVQPTIAADVRYLPFQDKCFSTVYASHVLEHFHRRESNAILNEWLRVVQPGGELQLFIPNLEWAALQIVNEICDEFVLNALYGRHEYDGDAHHTGFTPKIVKDLLNALPISYEIKLFRNSICVWATKLK